MLMDLNWKIQCYTRAVEMNGHFLLCARRPFYHPPRFTPADSNSRREKVIYMGLLLTTHKNFPLEV